MLCQKAYTVVKKKGGKKDLKVPRILKSQFYLIRPNTAFNRHTENTNGGLKGIVLVF